MLFKFNRYTLEESEDGYIVTLYIETQCEEFSSESNSERNCSENDILHKSIMAYIKKYLPDIKINIIKVIMGGALILTISMSSLESSLNISHAAIVYTESQLQYALKNNAVNVIVNKKIMNPENKSFVLDGITYVPIRDICEAIGADVIWDSKSNYAKIYTDTTNLEFQIGDIYCILNSVRVEMPQSIIVNDRVMVPLKFLSESFGFHTRWNETLKTAIISSTANFPSEKDLENIVFSSTKAKAILQKEIESQTSSYSQEDLYWLSRLVHAEARSEPYSGKLAVANVILNRVKSDEFPNSIKSVIFDTKNGVQFTPTVNGEIYRTPSDESTRAALEALNGNNNAKNIFYFFNPQKSPTNWIMRNRKFAFSISNHNFYY